jgi:hypothetical protein
MLATGVPGALATVTCTLWRSGCRLARQPGQRTVEQFVHHPVAEVRERRWVGAAVDAVQPGAGERLVGVPTVEAMGDGEQVHARDVCPSPGEAANRRSTNCRPSARANHETS